MKNIKDKVQDFVRDNKDTLGSFAKTLAGVSMVAGGLWYAFLKEAPRPSIRDLLPEVQKNQKLIVDEDYMKKFGGLNYTLYTDWDEDGLYDSYKKVSVGNTPGAYTVEYGVRENIKK
ncbi:MAG: hypothetical protein PF542_02860 [Nanoarchaeota archaeon]|jgi:hypothetical protein|nr:hypothetical protein [Nanoarchaeota archaeon]